MLKKRIAIIGLGSAGILTALHYLSFLDISCEVITIHDPKKDIIGIGESTNPSFMKAIERGLDFRIIDDLKSVDGTYKLGTYYTKWREHSFLNPLIQGGIAIHFNTHKLKEFAIPRMQRKWGKKFSVKEGTVSDILEYDDRIEVVVNGEVIVADFVVDCSGFPSDYDEYNLTETTVNHCLVHNIKEPGDWMYTGHRATHDGWMFEIPLSSRKSYGYLFNDKITDPIQAKQNFAKEINIPEDALDSIEYKFNSYYSKKLITGRYIKNGNRAAFFEPMFANSLFLYDLNARIAWDYILGKVTEDEANDFFIERCKEVEDMIHFHYHGGSTFNSEFWNNIVPISAEKIKQSRIFKEVTPQLQEQVRLKQYSEFDKPGWLFNNWSLMVLDKNLGYDYFANEASPNFISY